MVRSIKAYPIPSLSHRIFLAIFAVEEEPEREGDAGAAEDAADALSSLNIKKEGAAAEEETTPPREEAESKTD